MKKKRLLVQAQLDSKTIVDSFSRLLRRAESMFFHKYRARLFSLLHCLILHRSFPENCWTRVWNIIETDPVTESYPVCTSCVLLKSLLVRFQSTILLCTLTKWPFMLLTCLLFIRALKLEPSRVCSSSYNLKLSCVSPSELFNAEQISNIPLTKVEEFLEWTPSRNFSRIFSRLA